ncbi:hypothetical protein BZZ01_30610 [Nostocales cyanobacterium HT-58-2]|nr:hypothetical protein BZZ01_30610 [Nostocales cyanobacterium HT-58-2]
MLSLGVTGVASQKRAALITYVKLTSAGCVCFGAYLEEQLPFTEPLSNGGAEVMKLCQYKSG